VKAMIEVYEKEILSKTFTGLHQLRTDLPKVRDAFEKNFLAKWSTEGLIFGIYHYQNSFDRFALKLIQPTNANTHKIISISDLKPLNADGERLFKAMRNKPSTQEIFNFTFGIAENCYLLSIYINAPAQQFFITITKSN
jgi:hypothetical protein